LNLKTKVCSNYKTDAEVQAMTEQRSKHYAVAKEHRSGFANKAIDSAVKGAKKTRN
jgi:hypothetical protein